MTRVILITGANGSLGQAIARVFLTESPDNFVDVPQARLGGLPMTLGRKRAGGGSEQETTQITIQMFQSFQPALIVAEDLADGLP